VRRLPPDGPHVHDALVLIHVVENPILADPELPDRRNSLEGWNQVDQDFPILGLDARVPGERPRDRLQDPVPIEGPKSRKVLLDAPRELYLEHAYIFAYACCPVKPLLRQVDFVQRAGIAALSKEGDEAVERMRAVYDKRRKLMVELMRGVGFGYASPEDGIREVPKGLLPPGAAAWNRNAPPTYTSTAMSKSLLGWFACAVAAAGCSQTNPVVDVQPAKFDRPDEVIRGTGELEPHHARRLPCGP
jgi:hypothetical protein